MSLPSHRFGRQSAVPFGLSCAHTNRVEATQQGRRSTHGRSVESITCYEMFHLRCSTVVFTLRRCFALMSFVRSQGLFGFFTVPFFHSSRLCIRSSLSLWCRRSFFVASTGIPRRLCVRSSLLWCLRSLFSRGAPRRFYRLDGKGVHQSTDAFFKDTLVPAEL